MSSGVHKDSRNSAIVGRIFHDKLHDNLPNIHFNEPEEMIAILYANGIKKSDVKMIEYLGSRIVGLTNAGIPFKICLTN